MSRLVLVADDLGYCPERSEAILRLWALGAISTTSLIVNSHHSQQAATQAIQQRLTPGLHFNITEGRPTCPDDVSSLCDDQGRFLGKFGLRERARAGHVDGAHVARELRSQIEKFRAWFGTVPGHVDGHHHAHVVPGICDSFARVLSSEHIPWTRVPVEPDLDNVTDPQRRAFYTEVSSQAEMAANVFTQCGIRFAPRYIGMSTMGQDMILARLGSLLPDHQTSTNHSPDNVSRDDTSTNHNQDTIPRDCDVIEWMVHPGFSASKDNVIFGQGPDEFAVSSDRKYEFDFLASSELHDLLRQRNITLCSFRDIA